MTRVQRRNADESRKLLLDAAERQFAMHGYDGVSMRMIASDAAISLGLLTYHFPTKEQLFEMVIARRADELNHVRRQAFDALRTSSIHDIMDAFSRPIVDALTGPDRGWHFYARLLAVMGRDPRWAALVTSHFLVSVNEGIERLIAAEPRLDLDSASEAFSYAISVFTGTFAVSGSDALNYLPTSSQKDLRAAYPTMLDFIVGGIEKIAHRREVTPPPVRGKAKAAKVPSARKAQSKAEEGRAVSGSAKRTSKAVTEAG